MSLDLNFYKKDYVEIEDWNVNGTIKDRRVLEEILSVLGMEKDNVNGDFIEIPKDKVLEVVAVIGQRNEDGFLNGIIGEMITLYTKGEAVYFNGSW